MDLKAAIERVKAARQPEDIFVGATLKEDFRALAKVLHPDKAGKGAEPYFSKLNRLHEEAKTKLVTNSWGIPSFTHGSYSDDSGLVFRRGSTLYFTGPGIDRSLAFWTRLTALKDNGSRNLAARYLPSSMKATPIYVNGVNTPALAVEMPLGENGSPTPGHRLASKTVTTFAPSGLPQEHVAWILSRILECVGYLQNNGFIHAGLHPSSIHVLPERHGICVSSFYHAISEGENLRTVSAEYKRWYPPAVFDKKRAGYDLDVLMAKRVAVYLLGDKSGNGTKLKMDPRVDPRFVNALLRTEKNGAEAYAAHREMLTQIFGKPKYHRLDLSRS